MKKFSDELASDREFEFMGELFKYKFVHWRTATDNVQRARDEAARREKEKATPTATEDFEWTIREISQYIDSDNDGPQRMEKLLNNGDERPVPIGQVNELYTWLLEVSAGRPTEQPEPSQPGASTTRRTSRVG